MFADLFNHFTQIILDFIVPETQHRIINLREIHRPLAIVLLGAAAFPAVNVNDELLFRATEIHHIGTVGLLTHEAVAECLMLQLRPEFVFLGRRALGSGSLAIFW